MEMPDDVLPVPAVLMFSILLLSSDNFTSPVSGVAVGMEKGTCGSAAPPPGTGGKGGGKRQ